MGVWGWGEHPRTQIYALELTLVWWISAQGLDVVMMCLRHCGLIPLVTDCLPLQHKALMLSPISPFASPKIPSACTTSNPRFPSLDVRCPLCLCPALSLLASLMTYHCLLLYGRPSFSLAFPTEETLYLGFSFFPSPSFPLCLHVLSNSLFFF